MGLGLMNPGERHSFHLLMASSEAGAKSRRGPLSGRNAVVLAAAVACLVAGYVVLGSGAASAGAVLLVVGYCVLFPLAIAL